MPEFGIVKKGLYNMIEGKIRGKRAGKKAGEIQSLLLVLIA